MGLKWNLVQDEPATPHEQNKTHIPPPATINLQTACRFFTLPRELRDHIYDLVHLVDTDTTSEIALELATPPSNSLSLTCKAIKAETHKTYIRNYRLYWTSTRFELSFSAQRPAIAHVQKLKHQDVKNIRTLMLVYDDDSVSRRNGQPYTIWLRRRSEPRDWQSKSTFDGSNPWGDYPSYVSIRLVQRFIDAMTAADPEYAEHQDKALLAKRGIVLSLRIFEGQEIVGSWKDSVVG